MPHKHLVWWIPANYKYSYYNYDYYFVKYNQSGASETLVKEKPFGTIQALISQMQVWRYNSSSHCFVRCKSRCNAFNRLSSPYPVKGTLASCNHTPELTFCTLPVTGDRPTAAGVVPTLARQPGARAIHPARFRSNRSLLRQVWGSDTGFKHCVRGRRMAGPTHSCDIQEEEIPSLVFLLPLESPAFVWTSLEAAD